MIARRYWDSSVFLAWLLPEPERKPDCETVIRAAERGNVQIVTSALTMTEVIKLKGQPGLTQDHEKKIVQFFQHEYIVVREVDRFVAETARALIWKHPHLQPKDSIHVATAIRWKIGVLDTYDKDDMIPLDGQLGSPVLRIGHPHMPGENLNLPGVISSPKKKPS